MFGSEILEVAIGLSLVFLFLSLICTAVSEMVEQRVKGRAAHLHEGMRALLGNRLTTRLYTHPLIYGLYENDYPDAIERRTLPSYIPSRAFALAVFDLVVNDTDDDRANNADSFLSLTISRRCVVANRARTSDAKLVYDAVLNAIDAAQFDAERALGNLENWYDSAMDRVSGRFKRQAQRRVLVAGTLLAIGLNANAIAIAKHLYTDRPSRELAIAQAEEIKKSGVPADSVALQAIYAEIEKLQIPLGWNDQRVAPPPISWVLGWWVLVSLAGWTLTVLAVSLGAPFWFDMMNKFMVIRSTVKPSEKSGEEGSEDRRSNKSAVLTGGSNLFVSSGTMTGAIAATGVGPSDGPKADGELHWSVVDDLDESA
jgi:hypothetical protein